MPHTSATSTPARLLIIDDSPENLDALSLGMRRKGYEVLTADNGHSGLDLAARTQPDLILLDILMPNIDGYEVCRRLKADETTRDIPVIFLSALSDTEVKVKAFEAGGVDYVTKPLHFKEVLARVRTHLRLKEMQMEADEARRDAEAANQAKSSFLAQMSHELRTPLTAILGAADLMLDRSLSENARLDFARMIRRNGEHLLSLLNDVLDISKIEAGQLIVEVVACPITEVLTESATLMQWHATQKGLDFDLRLLTPIPTLIFSDPTRLRMILLNLMGNAIKFTERGRISVEVRHEPGADVDRLTVEVVDTGIGMTAEQLGRLFQPFQQGDASMTRRFGGTGLGLAISRALAAALGGEIQVRSVLGQGSTFTLTLKTLIPRGTPMVGGLSLNPAPAPSEGENAARQVRGRVLLVEDNPDSQAIIQAMLRKAGLDVATAQNGRDGADMALRAWTAAAPFDLILMDMQIPVLDGYSATRELRQRGYFAPIVALTAHALTGERGRCLEAGCDDYLRKPIDPAAFAQVLEQHLPVGTTA